MRRDKLSRLLAGANVAEARQSLACLVVDVDSIAEIWRFFIHTQSWPELPDVAYRIFFCIVHVERAGTMHVVPLRLVFAVAVENLNAVILAIRDVDPTFLVGANVVHDVELSGIGTRFSPRQQQFAVRRIFMHARIAVAVRNINIALGREGYMRAAIKRFAALIGRRLSRNSDRQKNFSIQGAFADRVIAVIGQKNRLLRSDGRAVRPLENAVPPRPQQITIAVEDDHWMFAAGETIDLIFVIHGHGGDFMKGPIVRQLSPAFDHFVTVLTAVAVDRSE